MLLRKFYTAYVTSPRTTTPIDAAVIDAAPASALEVGNGMTISVVAGLDEDESDVDEPEVDETEVDGTEVAGMDVVVNGSPHIGNFARSSPPAGGAVCPSLHFPS